MKTILLLIFSFNCVAQDTINMRLINYKEASTMLYSGLGMTITGGGLIYFTNNDFHKSIFPSIGYSLIITGVPLNFISLITTKQNKKK